MIIYSKYIPLKDFYAINICGWIIINSAYREVFERNAGIYNKVISHEKIHSRQGRELLWIFFYIWYGIEYIIRLIQYKDKKKAYRNISFEREAYANETNHLYLQDREQFGFLKYL